MQRNLTLYIPEDCKPRIFSLLQKVHQENFPTVKKRKKAKAIYRKTTVYMNLTMPIDLKIEWEKCIQYVENCEPLTIFDFWGKLQKKAEKYFYIKKGTGHNSPYNQRALSWAISTALVKSLFIQFDKEPDIHRCSERLFEAVPNATCVTWAEIDTSKFRARLNERWAAFHSLFICSRDYYSFHPSLFKGVGLSDDDFIRAFFKEQPLSEAKQYHASGYAPDILMLIGTYLLSQDLSQYRQVSRANYNAIEKNATLRVQHRLHVISKNILLQQFVGRSLFISNDYFLSMPTNEVYKYRLTKIKSPFKTKTYSSGLSQWDEMMGGYVSENSGMGLIILTAFRNSIDCSSFTIRKIHLSSFNSYLGEKLQIKVKHDAKGCNSDYPSRSYWKRFAIFKVKDDDVTVNVKFEECKIGSPSYLDKLIPTGVVENIQANFKMSDFEQNAEFVVNSRKL